MLHVVHPPSPQPTPPPLHVVACFCLLLGVVAQSKPFKVLSQQLPTFLLFRDHVAPCLIPLHSSPNIVGATPAHYAWSPKSYGLYPSYEALQVPILLGQQCWELLRPLHLAWSRHFKHPDEELALASSAFESLLDAGYFTLLIPLEARFIGNSHRALNVRDRLGRQKHKLAASCPPFPSNEAVTINTTNFPRGLLRLIQRSGNARSFSKITWKQSVP